MNPPKISIEKNKLPQRKKECSVTWVMNFRRLTPLRFLLPKLNRGVIIRNWLKVADTTA